MKLYKTILLELKVIFSCGIYLFFPFMFLLVTGFIYINDIYSYIREVIAFGLFTAVLLVLVTVLNSLQIRKIIFGFLSIILVLLLFVKMSFYMLYGAKINASALFVIFETNTYEASEFLNSFINKEIIVLFFVLLLMLVFVLIKTFRIRTY